MYVFQNVAIEILRSVILHHLIYYVHLVARVAREKHGLTAKRELRPQTVPVKYRVRAVLFGV